MTDAEFTDELVKRLNKLCTEPDEKEALHKLMEVYVRMPPEGMMSVDRLLQRLAGCSKKGWPTIGISVHADGQWEFYVARD